MHTHHAHSKKYHRHTTCTDIHHKYTHASHSLIETLYITHTTHSHTPHTPCVHAHSYSHTTHSYYVHTHTPQIHTRTTLTETNTRHPHTPHTHTPHTYHVFMHTHAHIYTPLTHHMHTHTPHIHTHHTHSYKHHTHTPRVHSAHTLHTPQIQTHTHVHTHTHCRYRHMHTHTRASLECPCPGACTPPPPACVSGTRGGRRPGALLPGSPGGDMSGAAPPYGSPRAPQPPAERAAETQVPASSSRATVRPPVPPCRGRPLGCGDDPGPDALTCRSWGDPRPPRGRSHPAPRVGRSLGARDGKQRFLLRHRSQRGCHSAAGGRGEKPPPRPGSDRCRPRLPVSPRSVLRGGGRGPISTGTRPMRPQLRAGRPSLQGPRARATCTAPDPGCARSRGPGAPLPLPHAAPGWLGRRTQCSGAHVCIQSWLCVCACCFSVCEPCVSP